MKIDDSSSAQPTAPLGRATVRVIRAGQSIRSRARVAFAGQGCMQKMIEAICRIPVTLKAEDSSMLALVRRPSYLESLAGLSNDVLVPYLREHPELIDAWLGYSSDKRTSSGWYFKQTGQEAFEVGYFPRGERRSYTDAARACAEFIVNELREVWGHAG